MPTERHGEGRRVILANPDEPRAGDYSWGLYDKAHPIFGESDTVAYFRRELRGLRGQTINLRVSGVRINENKEKHSFNINRQLTVNRYSDIFGPGSAYLSAIKEVRDKYSNETMVTHTLTIEVL